MPPDFRILHIAHGITSCHNSLLELLRRLHNCNIEVITASHANLSHLLQPAGYSFCFLTDDVELETERQQAMLQCRRKPRPWRWIEQYKVSQSIFRRSLRSKELDRVIQECHPDLLLIDMECHRAIIQSFNADLPLVLLSRWYSVFRHQDTPPMHTQLQPPDSWPGSLKIRWAWMKLGWYKRRQSMTYSLSRQRFKQITYGTSARPALKKLARACNISLRKISDTSHWLIPHVYTSLPVMSLTLDVMEFGAARDERMHYVGAMVGDESTHHPHFSQSKKQLQQFLQRFEHQRNPLIYCSLSTFWNTGANVLTSILELFNKRTDLDLVLGMGNRTATGKWPDTGPNILLLSYAPQLTVLKHASIAITHGGVSTINEALVHGVPLIVINAGHVDQPGCTARVVHHGVGLVCHRRPLDPIELGNHIDYILGDTGKVIRENVEKIRKVQIEHDEQRTAVNFLRSRVESC